MPLTHIRLPLLQNGLHSIYHALEHLKEALVQADSADAAAYDADVGSIEIATSHGKSWYVADPFLKLPKAYGIKFAILHLIHGLELLVKVHLDSVAPGSTTEKGRPGRTISMRTAARRLVALRPDLLDPDHLELVLRAGEFRNQIEHAAIDITWEEATRLALDFLSIVNYLAYVLHDVRLSGVFGFDPYKHEGDSVGDEISAFLSQRSIITEAMVERLATEWAARRPSEQLVRCLNCGAKGVSLTSQTCMACGDDAGGEAGLLVEELEKATKRLLSLRQSLTRADDYIDRA